MFDLEQSIADWRRQMLAAGIKTPVPLEELEIHLREEIERQTKSGLKEQDSFNFAVKQFGESSNVKQEFSKIGNQQVQPGHAKPASLNILAIWYVMMGLVSLATIPKFFLGSYFWLGSSRLSYLICAFLIVIFSLQVLTGVGLLRHQNFWRIIGFFWPVLLAFWFFHPQVEVFLLRCLGHDAHIIGWTSNQYFLGLPLPRIIVTGIHLLNLVILFWGCHVLSKSSIRKLFLPTLASKS
jgi:hypothetical protein